MPPPKSSSSWQKQTPPTQPLTCGFLIYDGFEALDLTGPRTAFFIANGKLGARYRLQTIGMSHAPTKSECGLSIAPDIGLLGSKRQDVLIIPGGEGSRRLHLSASECDALKNLIHSAHTVVTICTGAYVLAELGFLEGRTSAIHWNFAYDFQKRFPNIKVDGDSIYCRDDKFWTSGGITAGIDLTLHLIARDYGALSAALVGRHMNMYVQRSGDQAQYSVPLGFQGRASGDLAKLIDLIVTDPTRDLCVAQLADLLGYSERTLARHVDAQFGLSPAKLVDCVRLDLARQMLESSRAKIESIALASGFQSADSFSRSFERAFAIRPNDYRRSFEGKR